MSTSIEQPLAFRDLLVGSHVRMLFGKKSMVTTFLGTLMLSDYAISIVASLTGIVVLAFSLMALSVRAKGNQVITWRGLGVTFEIKPCAKCRHLEK